MLFTHMVSITIVDVTNMVSMHAIILSIHMFQLVTQHQLTLTIAVTMLSNSKTRQIKTGYNCNTKITSTYKYGVNHAPDA